MNDDDTRTEDPSEDPSEDGENDGDEQEGATELEETDEQVLAMLRDIDAEIVRWLANQNDVATALRRMRKRQGLSLSEASYRAGISKSYLWRIEHGQHAPLQTLDAIGRSALSMTTGMARALLALAVECNLRVRNDRLRANRRPTVG